MRFLPAVLTLLAVVIAGCVAPTTDPTTAPTNPTTASSGAAPQQGAWTDLALGVEMPVKAVLVHPHGSASLFAGGKGLQRSDDDGAHWVSIRGGTMVGEVEAVAVIPGTNGQAVLAATGSGVFRTTDGGRTWSYPSMTDVHALRQDPSQPLVAYGSSWSGGSGACRIARTSDGGATWSLHGEGVFLPYCSGVYFDVAASQPSKLYAALGSSASRAYLYVSNDGATTWSALPGLADASGNPLAIAVDPSDPNVAYLLSDRTGIWRTKDGASTWTNVSPTGGSHIAISRHDPSTLYVTGGGNRLMRSDDGGTSWRQVLDTQACPASMRGDPCRWTALGIDEASGDRLMVATTDHNAREGRLLYTASGGE